MFLSSQYHLRSLCFVSAGASSCHTPDTPTAPSPAASYFGILPWKLDSFVLYYFSSTFPLPVAAEQVHKPTGVYDLLLDEEGVGATSETTHPITPSLPTRIPLPAAGFNTV